MMRLPRGYDPAMGTAIIRAESCKARVEPLDPGFLLC